jgi:hypothetical protein
MVIAKSGLIANFVGSPAPRQGEYKDYYAEICQRIILLL